MVAFTGVVTTSGVGFTVIVIDGIVAVHPAGVVAVTLYVTVPGVEPEAVSTCEMLLPEPPELPATPEDVAVQLKVVPAILLVKGIEVDVPEQIAEETGLAEATGFGLTSIVIDKVLPGQELAVGVTTYTTDPGVEPEAVRICAIEVPLPELPPEAPV
jgi:hypothetical protein